MTDLALLGNFSCERFHRGEHRRKLSPVRNCLCPFGAPGGAPPCIRHLPFALPGTGMASRSVFSLRNVWPGAYPRAWGVDSPFIRTLPPSTLPVV